MTRICHSFKWSKGICEGLKFYFTTISPTVCSLFLASNTRLKSQEKVPWGNSSHWAFSVAILLLPLRGNFALEKLLENFFFPWRNSDKLSIQILWSQIFGEECWQTICAVLWNAIGEDTKFQSLSSSWKDPLLVQTYCGDCWITIMYLLVKMI